MKNESITSRTTWIKENTKNSEKEQTTDTAPLIPGTIWITGITASGKTTLGKSLFENLKKIGIDRVKFLDGGELRKELDRVYGYSVEERFAVAKNIVRVAQEYNAQGHIVVVSTISHKKEMREFAREQIENFMEVYLQCSIETCAKRDYGDHYRRAFAGDYEMFVGVTDFYEKSETPDIILDTASASIQECSEILLERVLDIFKSI